MGFDFVDVKQILWGQVSTQFHFVRVDLLSILIVFGRLVELKVF